MNTCCFCFVQLSVRFMSLRGRGSDWVGWGGSEDKDKDKDED